MTFKERPFKKGDYVMAAYVPSVYGVGIVQRLVSSNVAEVRWVDGTIYQHWCGVLLPATEEEYKSSVLAYELQR